MMIVMKETATEQEVGAVIEKIERAGAGAHRIAGARVTVIGAIGDVEQDVSVEALAASVQLAVDNAVEGGAQPVGGNGVGRVQDIEQARQDSGPASD